MKNTIILFFLLTFTINTYSQNDSILRYTYNKENVVASAIDGAWRRADKKEIRITFQKDTSVLKLIPKKYYEFLINEIIYHVGFMVLDNEGKKYPFVLIVLNGNPHLVFFRESDNEPYGDGESFNLFIAKGETRDEDRLFIGGDFNNQSFHEFLRID